MARVFTRASAPANSVIASSRDITVSHGYGQLPEILNADRAGARTVAVMQGERIEIRLPRGFESAYQLVADGKHGDLPIGSTWDAASGILYWQPAPGFLGRYRFVFANGAQRILLRVFVIP